MTYKEKSGNSQEIQNKNFEVPISESKNITKNKDVNQEKANDRPEDSSSKSKFYRLSRISNLK